MLYGTFSGVQIKYYVHPCFIVALKLLLYYARSEWLCFGMRLNSRTQYTEVFTQDSCQLDASRIKMTRNILNSHFLK